jgi:transglutaminase-like putative cysteine protease
MRFAVAHKTATYLMVTFSFFALIGGGQMSPLVSYGGMLALLISWWWEAPRIKLERWGWVWTVLSVLVFAYCLLTAIVTLDFLMVGAEFLVWLTMVKAFNRRAARDWQQMYLLAFLMLVAGSVLNPDLTYGLFFFGFVITVTWAMTLFHLRREMEDNLLVKHAADRASERVEVRRILDSRRIVGGRFFLGTGLLSFGVFLGAAIVFLALPRVGIGFFVKSRGGLTLAGFSDGVKLGGHGVIKKDSTVVMRVEIESRYGGREAPEIHWRGVAFDEYSQGQWTRSLKAPRTNQTLEQSPTRDRRVLLWTGAALPIPEIERLAANSVKQEVWLDPLDSDVLFGASNPRILEYAHTLRRRNPIERNDEIRLEHGTTVHYTVYSDLSSPPVEQLRASAGELSKEFKEVYLQLPREITDQTKALAREITKDAPTQYDKVMAIKSWLAKNATYTLELEDPGKTEPVHFFLFDRKQGHCEYFASAFAILARAVGIPTRQVNGFLGGEWNEYQGYIAVRAGDAHSWDEVFYPGVDGTGVWVTVDPTPAGDVDLMGRGGGGWRAKMSRFIDTLRFQWTKWVIEYDLVSQLSLFKSIGRGVKTAAVAVKDAAIWLKDRAVEYWPVSSVLGALLIGGLIVRRRKKRSKLPPEGRVVKPRDRSSVAEIFDRVAKQLSKAGFPRTSSTTPRELASKLVAHPVGAQVSELVELYYAAEWGGRRDDKAEDRAEALATSIKQTLREAKQRKAS